MAGRLFAAPASSPRFLLVFLRGGYDCANMLVPYTSDFYYTSRPNIAIAKPDPSLPGGALSLDAEWALAPALRASIGQLYADKEAAFVPFAGTEDLSRSHFETQESIERGQPLDQHDYRSGFMARLASILTGRAPSIAFTDALPLAFSGNADIPNISLRSVTRPAFDERQTALLADMYQDHHLRAVVAEGLELRQQIAKEFDDEMQKANRGAVTARGFANEATRIARLMREQYRSGDIRP
jgi:uncharacterized protein (DUF1501 family)